MQVRRITDRDRWNAFLERHAGPVYDLWEWGELCELYGHETAYYGAVDGGDLLGVVPVVHMRGPIFGDKLVSMPFSEYGSLVVADDAPEAVTELLLERVRESADRRGVDFVSLRGRPLDGAEGFTRKRRFVTFEIPVDDVDDAWDALDSSRRTHVRKARENGLEVRRAESVDDLERYYDLFVENQRRFGSPPHSFAFFRRLWAELGDVMSVDLAFDGETLVNGGIVFEFADRCFDWSRVTRQESRDLQGGSLLLWHAIERACEDGSRSRLSLGRTREGTGIYTYKKSWGGEKTWLEDYHYFPTGEVELPNPDSEKYDRAKDAWRKLPVGVTKLVGPQLRKRISL